MKIIPLVLIAVMAFAPLAQLRAAEDAPNEKEQERLRQELREARREMEKAARRVAELSREMGYEHRLVRRDFERDVQHFRMGGDPDRLMLGVMVGSGSERMRGLEVLSVTPGGPADTAGLQAGDVIIAVNEMKLDVEDGAAALSTELDKVKPGAEVKVAFRRGTDQRTVDVIPEAIERRFGFFAPPAPGAPLRLHAPLAARFLDLVHGWGDIELVSVSKQLGEYFGTDKGLLVVNTPKGDFKLQDGDVILSIGGRVPEDPAHGMRILGSYRAGEKVNLEIMRKRKKQSLEIEIPERRVSIEMIPRIEHEIITEAIAPN